MGLLQKASLVITPNAVKAGKLYSVIPNNGTGDLDAVRATSATRVNSAGLIEIVGNNIARIDYTNGSCPSILVEPQRTNLISNSNFANNDSGFTKKTQKSSPDGLNNAILLTEDTLNNQKLVNSVSASILGNTTYAYSVFLKYNGIQNITINATDSISGFARTFDILNGVVVSISTDAFIIPYTDGWYRCIIIRTTGASAVKGFIQINLGFYLGDGIKGFYWFGAQIEQGSNATSYIPTTSSTVTRVADRNNIILTNRPFWNKNNFTIYWEGTFLDGSPGQATFGFGNITDIISSIQSTVCFYNNGNGLFRIQDGTSPGGLIIGSSLPNGSNYKLIIKREGTEIKWFRNGMLLGIRTGEVVDYTYLGLNSGGSTYYLNKSFMIPSSLTDQECINLTTL